jgi:hypothetical protein
MLEIVLKDILIDERHQRDKAKGILRLFRSDRLRGLETQEYMSEARLNEEFKHRLLYLGFPEEEIK